MTDLERFREDTRAWLSENCPAAMCVPTRDAFADIYMGGRNPEVSHPDQVLWCNRMAAKGWTVPTWPVAYGGAGLSKDEAKVLSEEMHRIGARSPLFSFGISMLAPVLFEYGTEEQKQEYLPEIARGEVFWCQGYSEPGAGSDLASLQTRAEDRGDHYIVNGQKVWTSYGDKADWCFCLVRTDNSGTKHDGISFVLFDMKTSGVATRPIKLISGSSPFCEMFFDDVKVLKENLVGEEGKGWAIAKYLLTHERGMISGLGASTTISMGTEAIEQLGSDPSGRLANSVLRQNIAQYELDAVAFGATMERVGDEAKAGEGMGAASSIFKYYGSELNKRRNELNVAVGGEAALNWGSVASDWLRSKGNSIEGGTTEIQLNIISKRVLDLPDA